MSRVLALVALVLALPVAGVLSAWVTLDTAGLETLRHQWYTVMPGYVVNSLLLAGGVAIGVAALGAATAVLITLFDFPLRATLEWALLLPLAMPAYVLAYATTDALQYSGPLQTWLRAATGAGGALWPDVRSLWGAAVLFVLCLYPYVYLLTRAALNERGVHLMDAARALGAGTSRRIREVALPLARPAIAAGVALALMETLADYGVGSYFGLQTFTTGIFKAWLVMNDGPGAAQLASLLLFAVAVLLWLERSARRRARFAGVSGAAASSSEARPMRLRGFRAGLALSFCAAPVLFGFVLPVAALLRLLAQEFASDDVHFPLVAFARAGWVSLQLGVVASLLAVVLAVLLAFELRTRPGLPLRWAVRVISLGYAVPGAVIAVGILLPLAWLEAHAPQWRAGALVTGTLFGVLYAYQVRFSAVALQSLDAGYERIPASIDETARLLGVSRWRLLRRLHAPLLRRASIAALLLVFVDVMKELPATLVLRPFNSDTLAVLAYQFARDERLGEAALPSLAIVLVGLIPVLLLSRAMRGR